MAEADKAQADPFGALLEHLCRKPANDITTLARVQSANEGHAIAATYCYCSLISCRAIPFMKNSCTVASDIKPALSHIRVVSG